MLQYPLQPYPHIQYPVIPIKENLHDTQMLDEVTILSDDRESVHVIEKSLDSVTVFLVVGTLLSAMITGSLATMERYVECPVTPAMAEITRQRAEVTSQRAALYWRVDTGSLALLCTAASHKLVTVVTWVWLPIITFCLLRYHKTETINTETEEMHQVFVK